MKQDSNGWVRVSRSARCTICGKPDWCQVTADGSLAHCMRIESSRAAKSGGWLHRADGDRLPASEPLPIPTTRKDPDELDRVWRPLAEQCARDGESRLSELANLLGVKTEALQRLGVGWGDLGGWCWTFPEFNWEHKVVGISRRFSDGAKRSVKGSRRGITFEAGVESRRDGPLFVVEGPTDTAALIGLGLRAVGRPSNVGGLGDLRLLIERTDRVVVIGENDRVPHAELSATIRERHSPRCTGCAACWPGLYGAQLTASKLLAGSRGDVRYVMPPSGVKDVRALVKKGLFREDIERLFSVGGQSIL